MFLVDGYNAIRRVERLKAAERGAGLAAGRRALLLSIVASGVLRAERVLVVFDGIADSPGVEPSPHPRLGIRFSVPPQDADGLILSLLEGSQGSAVTVVTADQDLTFESRRLGARVVTPEVWSGLKSRPAGKLRKRRESRGSATEKPNATAADVDYWLRIFEEGKDER